MGLFANAFTWWNGASWSTALFSHRNGEEVGRDAEGNIYFKHRKDPARRWVIYAGANDSSRVAPGWNAWLRGTIEGLPDQSLPERRSFEAAPQANLTGSDRAWRPAGSIRSGGQRPAATGDYSAWTPDQA